MRRVVVVSLVGLVLVVSAGCARKKPATAASPSDETPYPSAPVEPQESESALPEDPLAGDIDAVNQYVHASGLLRDVYYRYDSSDLSPESRETLAANARFLNEHRAFEISIEGHCDERGTAEYNLALGERRASAARDYLTRLGVDGSRLDTISFGEERPVCSVSEESCWSKNRRSHPVIVARRAGGS